MSKVPGGNSSFLASITWTKGCLHNFTFERWNLFFIMFDHLLNNCWWNVDICDILITVFEHVFGQLYSWGKDRLLALPQPRLRILWVTLMWGVRQSRMPTYFWYQSKGSGSLYDYLPRVLPLVSVFPIFGLSVMCHLDFKYCLLCCFICEGMLLWIQIRSLEYIQNVKFCELLKVFPGWSIQSVHAFKACSLI